MGAPDQPDEAVIDARTSDGRPSLLRTVLAAARGAAAGVICLVIGFALAFAVIPASQPDVQPCGDDDLPCLPDLGPIIVALVVIGVAIPVVSPLVAWVLRLPRPWYFLLAGLWVSVLVVASLMGTVLSNSPTVVFFILALAPYALLAMWTVARATTDHGAGRRFERPPIG